MVSRATGRGGRMSDRSVSAHDIKKSVVVTGDGNSVALTFGNSGIILPLRRRQFPPPDRRHPPREGEPPRELDLLVPEAGKLPLVGRQDLLAEFQAWLDDENDISVYGLIGRAGTGKTRLAIKFCRITDGDANGKGPWVAGFLSPTDLDEINKAFATRSFDWERNTLLVFDYAAQCHEALGRWLDRLAARKLDTKLRILLLDREAPDNFGWWHALTVLGSPARRDLFYELRPRQLPDLSDLEERRSLIAGALRAARELRPGASGTTPIPVKDQAPNFDRRLAAPQFGNPLNLVMAGVIAVDRGPQAALALRRLDAARQIARRELDHRLKPLGRSRHIGEDEICHIVAFNGLAGGLPIADLRKVVADELAISHRPAERLSEIVDLLEQEFPVRPEAVEQSRLATIQPDLIGEAMIVEVFSGGPSRQAEAAEVVRRAYELSREAAAQALIRIVQDFAYALEDPSATDEERSTGDRVMGWLLAFAETVDDPEQLMPFAFALPAQTTILREPAAALTQKLATYFRNKAQESNDPAAFVYSAGFEGNLANRLSDLGRREDALQAAEEAVGHYRGLAAARPDAFIPNLALSMTNLANRLSALGRREDALQAAEEAVGHYRGLAAARPDAFIPDLAGSLNNLAGMLSDLGRREEALTAAEEAVGHCRGLAAARPDAFLPDLALSLNNLAGMLSDLGRREEALTAAEEAVGHYRALAAARPDAFLPDLAGSLNTLVGMLSALGRREDALQAAEEAVGHYRVLAAARPDAFIPNLALSLNNLANMLSALERREDALQAAEEAVGHYRALAAARPDAFVVGLARSLWVLGDLYGDTEKPDIAAASLAEAIQILSPTFLNVPEAVVEVMSGMLQSYLARCEAIGREPDIELLSPVAAAFEKMQQQEEKE
ncbi:MAG: tetratricopeptide repeat protein [Alphaproteobacteria bacterium]|nr:tetratricopeptide repeat protein [Alphaproteobacteria bacterium]